MYFDTGFIYRFGCAGVIDFGGEEDSIIDTCTVTWKSSDIQTANTNLQKMKEERNLPDPNIASYDKSKQGTYSMLADLIAKGNIPNEYLLGSVICHQLQYKVPLESTFMTGQPNTSYNSDCDTCDDENPYYEPDDSSEYGSE